MVLLIRKLLGELIKFGVMICLLKRCGVLCDGFVASADVVLGEHCQQQPD